MNVLIKLNVPEDKIGWALQFVQNKLPDKMSVGENCYASQGSCGPHHVFNMMAVKNAEDRMTITVNYDAGEPW